MFKRGIPTVQHQLAHAVLPPVLSTRLRRSALSALLLTLTGGCSIYSPNIISQYHQLTINQESKSGVIYESLTYFAQVQDEDGVDDFYALDISHKESHLSWTLPADGWIEISRNGGQWVGEHTLLAPQGGPLPRGQYDVTLSDLYGHTTNATFSVNLPPLEVVNFPEVTQVGENIVEVSGEYENYQIWGYDAEEELLFSQVVSDKTTFFLDSLRGEIDLETLDTFYIYTAEPLSYYGILTGPYLPFKEEREEGEPLPTEGESNTLEKAEVKR